MVHFHLLPYGEYVRVDKLADLWSEAIGERAIVHIKAVRVDGALGVAAALREVLKYVTKGEGNSRQQARHAAAVELAFRHVHRISVGGALWNIRRRNPARETEGVWVAEGPQRRLLLYNGRIHVERQADGLEEPPPKQSELAVMTCENCGGRTWEWNGIYEPQAVSQNGGYGQVVVPPNALLRRVTRK